MMLGGVDKGSCGCEGTHQQRGLVKHLNEVRSGLVVRVLDDPLLERLDDRVTRVQFEGLLAHHVGRHGAVTEGLGCVPSKPKWTSSTIEAKTVS